MGTDQCSTSDVFFIDTYNGTTGTTPFVILTNGNVGIGTTAPSATLEVGGYTKLSGPAAIVGATVPGIATALFTGNLPTGNYFAPNQASTVGFGSGYEYGYFFETAANTLRLSVGTNADNVKNSADGAVKIMVTYQQ